MNSWNTRILVIDDNLAIHEDVRKILCAEKQEDARSRKAEEILFGESTSPDIEVTFAVDSAYQGQEGLTRLEEARARGKPYALAFVDVRMPPGWDGIETIRHLWQSDPDLQVVICTAYSDYDWNDITRNLGTSDNLLILKKPFDNVEIIQLAHALTRKWTLGQQARLKLDDMNRMVAQRTQELQTANATLQREITERTTAESTASRLEERFAKAFRASPMPLAIQSLADERFVEVNEGFLGMTGFRLDQVVGRHPLDLHLWVEPAAREQFLGKVRQQRSVRNFEAKLRTQAGAVREALLAAEIFDLGDEPHFLVIIQDISARLALETQLRQAQKMESVGQLAAGVAHDFNNILTIIQGYTSLLLLEHHNSPLALESLKQISEAGQRAADLTRQLLTFSRKQFMRPTLVDFNELVSNLTKMLNRLLGEHITLRVRYAPQPPVVFVDTGMLEQVLINLGVNARDAMPTGGQLTIQTELVELESGSAMLDPEAGSGRYLCLKVTDTGHGMDEATLSRIFEPFFTTKEVGKGTGLGLATVYGIVKQHHGWVKVQSQVGQGTTFQIFLPLTDGALASVKAGEDTRFFGGSETILVVEDEEPLRKIVESVLRRQGFKVLTAPSGLEALEVWAERGSEIDLLLTDMVMPNGITGGQLASRLLAEKPSLRVIYTSGYNADFYAPDRQNRAGTEFLAKPYVPTVLVNRVRDCLDRGKSREPASGGLRIPA